MLPDNLNDVTASYHRCLQTEGFIDTFYERFLAKSPKIAKKFRNTHFTRQKMMLRESLLSMVMYNDSSVDMQQEIEHLGERHSRRGVDIPPEMYSLWLDALCETLQQHDPEFTPELAEKWRSAMSKGIELIISKY